MAGKGINKRIIELDEFARNGDVDPDVNIDRLQNDWPDNSQPWSANWWIPLDCKPAEGATDLEDHGTLRLPFSRVAMLDQSGKVPNAMLPGYVDEWVLGEMTITTGTGGAETQYLFHPTDGSGADYECPVITPGSDHRKPEGRFVYVARKVTIKDAEGEHVIVDGSTTPSEVQYRYLETAGGSGYFSPIPQTMVLKDGRGTLVVLGDADQEIDINIGTPQNKASGTTNPLAIATQDGKDKLIHCNSGVTAGTYTVLRKNDNITVLSDMEIDAQGHVTGFVDKSGTPSIADYLNYCPITSNYGYKHGVKDGSEYNHLFPPTTDDRSVLEVVANTNAINNFKGGHHYRISMDIQYDVASLTAEFARFSSYIQFTSDQEYQKFMLGDSVLNLAVQYPQFIHIDAVVKVPGNATTSAELGFMFGLPEDEQQFPSEGAYTTRKDDSTRVVRYSIRELL